MNDLFVSLIVIVVTGLMIGLIFLAVSRARMKKSGQVQQLALEKGWKYEAIKERLRSGYRLSAPGWVFETITASSGGPSAAGSSNVSSETHWISQQVHLPERMLLIGEQVGHPALGALGENLLQQAVQLLLGDEGADAAGLREIPAGSDLFQRRYMVWANDPADVERVLTPRLERVLLNWPGQPLPVIRFSSRGLRLDILHKRVEDLKELDAIITLGELLMETE